MGKKKADLWPGSFFLIFHTGALGSPKATTLVAAWLKTTDFQSLNFQPALAGT